MLVAQPQALVALQPLIDAHRERRPVHVFAPDANWQAQLDDVAGVLIIGERKRSPRTAMTAPFVTSNSGRNIPAGWLPSVNQTGLSCFAVAAAEVQRRVGPGGPIGLLGQWDAQVKHMVERSLDILSGQSEAPSAPVFWWTADRLIRRDLLTALRNGLGLAIYFGHGRPYGWSGYHGLHSRHLQFATGRPAGAILSLTCHTAKRHRGQLSFAEMIPLSGLAGAAFGAVQATRTVDNWRWGISMCEALASQSVRTVGELILRACTDNSEGWEACRHYRLLGDPLTPLLGAQDAAETCAAVWAPAPDASPVPPGYLQSYCSLQG